MFGGKDKIADLSRQLNDALAEKTLLENRLEDAANTIEQFASKESNYKKQIEGFNKQITTLKASHKTELDKLANSVNRKVNASLASIGVTKFANHQFSDAPSQTDAEIYQKFLALNGTTEQTEFYKTNKAAISRAMLNK